MKKKTDSRQLRIEGYAIDLLVAYERTLEYRTTLPKLASGLITNALAPLVGPQKKKGKE